MNIKPWLYASALCLGLVSLTAVAQQAAVPQNPKAIAEHFALKGKTLGMALDIHATDHPYVSTRGLPRIPRPDDYLARISPYFNFYTIPINFSNLHFKDEQSFDFTKSDAIAIFAASQHASIKGHALLFPATTPAWVTEGNYTPEQLRDILKTHIQTVVSHYKTLKEQQRKTFPGFTVDYHLTNEVTCNAGARDPLKCTQPGEILADGSTIDPRLVGLKRTVWSVIHKPGSSDPSDYIQLAFEWAHEADPEAKLVMAENVLTGPGLNFTYQHAAYLVAKHVPINAVGIEGHITLNWENTPYKHAGVEYHLNNAQNLIHGVTAGSEHFVGLDDFATLGLDTQITEFDVALTYEQGMRNFKPIMPSEGEAYQKALAKQGELYQTFMQICLQAKTCKLLTIFGAWDPLDYTVLHPEIPQGGEYREFFIDDDWHLKPAFWNMYHATGAKQ